MSNDNPVKPAPDHAGLADVLAQAEFWLEGALTCKSWSWDADQHEAASYSLARIREVIAALSRVQEPVAVKPLEWGEYRALGNTTKLLAFDAFGNEFARMDNPISRSAGELEAFKARKQADYERCIRSALATPPAQGKTIQWKPTHRHNKGGGEYRVIGEGKIQCAFSLCDFTHVTIYQAQDGSLWVRPTNEFRDGRFETL